MQCLSSRGGAQQARAAAVLPSRRVPRRIAPCLAMQLPSGGQQPSSTSRLPSPSPRPSSHVCAASVGGEERGGGSACGRSRSRQEGAFTCRRGVSLQVFDGSLPFATR